MNKQFVQFNFIVDNEDVKNILIAKLADIGFDGFEEKQNELIAFINENDLNEDELKLLISNHISYSREIIKEQNWNEVWESNFQPVIINDKVLIRAHFHQPIKYIQHEIIITPKMSFGTGHHATTHMMIETMLTIDFNDKTVLDFGTGTGVLAIFAEQCGAKFIKAIDNDEWSINNATENIQQNHCNKIKLLLADKPVASKKFDIVLANINKNIIMENFESIVLSLNTNAVLLLSGLLAEDETDIVKLSVIYNLKHIVTVNMDKWICTQFKN